MPRKTKKAPKTPTAVVVEEAVPTTQVPPVNEEGFNVA